MEVVLATNNQGKIEEFKQLMQGLPIKLIPQSELGVPSAEEVGSTFIENAIIKARHATQYTGLPALADDSGLCVDCLYDEPGVRSARYAGESASDMMRMQRLLKELESVEELDREACFHSVIALIEHETDPAPLVCHGVWSGRILLEPRGSNGFGYDPIFYVPTHDCSAAELSADDKNAISHRGQAMHQLVEVLREAMV